MAGGIGDYALPQIAAMKEIQKSMHKRDNPAQYLFDNAIKKLRDFQSQLTENQEPAINLISSGAMLIRIKGFSYENPDMFVFNGVDMAGNPVQILQHYTQLNMALVSVPKEVLTEPAYRIGFTAP
jgi:hypothetical protein